MAVLIVVSLMTMVVGVTPAGAAPTPNVTMVALYANDELTAAELPVGAGWEYLVNYSCATEDCIGYTIEIPFPAGVVIGSPSYGSDITGLDRTGDTATGTTLRFTMVSPLPPGTSGQLSIPASTPTFTTVDDTTFPATATMSSSVGGVPASTSTVTLTARADVDLRAAGSLTKGGRYDDIARYDALACLDQVEPPNVWGPLGAEADSQLVVTLPAGALLLDAGGGTVGGGPPATITWTLPQLTSNGCSARSFIVAYPATDPANSIGDTKVVDISWTAAELGKATDVYTGAISHTLGAPSGPSAMSGFDVGIGTPRQYGDAPTKKAAIGDPVSLYAGAVNRGDTTWTAAVIELPVPSQLRPSTISIANGGQESMELDIRTTCGPDRVAGTGDDDTWEPAATIMSGSSTGFDPATTWPSGADGIPGDCHVVSARASAAALWPNAGASVSMNTVLQAVDRAGDAVAEFDQFGFTATLDAQTEAPRVR